MVVTSEALARQCASRSEKRKTTATQPTRFHYNHNTASTLWLQPQHNCWYNQRLPLCPSQLYYT